MGAKDQVARLLTLVPYLKARGEVRLDEAAAALGVTAEQLLKDLKVLWMCGTPGGLPDDLIDVDVAALEPEDGDGIRTDGIIRVSNADYLAKPLRLTTTEATALIVALRALRSGAGDDTREVVDRALLATRLQGAADRRRQVRLSYYVPSRDEQSERVVDPRGVVNRDGHAYLDAWCHLAEAPRLFRLDRIVSAEVLTEGISTEPAAPRDLGDGFFTRDTEVTRATVLLEPAARWVTDYYPTEALREVGEGRLEVDFLVADQRWLTRLVLGLLPHARVLAPRSAAEAVMAAAQETLNLYS
jgi:proteasome accessory factor C